MTPFVFISHAAADKKRLAPYLQYLISNLDEHVELWIDNPEPIIRELGTFGQVHSRRFKGIEADADWWVDIQQHLGSAGCVLAFWSIEASQERHGFLHHEISVGIGLNKCVQVVIDPRNALSIPNPYKQKQIFDVSRFPGELGEFARAVRKVCEKLEQGKIISFPLIEKYRGRHSLNEVAEVVRTRAHEASQRLLDQMVHSRKYRETLYVGRTAFHADIRKFMKSTQPAYALVGASGIGKTSLVCSFVRKGDLHRTIFYSGSFLYSQDASKSCDIIQRLQADLGLPLELSRGQVVKFISEVAELWNKGPFLIAIDGVNEYPSPDRVLEAVNEIVEFSGANVKILLSCRDHIWKEVTRNRMVYSVKFFNLTSDGLPQKYLEGFTERELRAAYNKYRREYKLQTPYGSLKAHTRKAFENPLILRMAAMAFNGKALPVEVPEGSVFDVFYKEQIKSNRAIALFLASIVRMMRTARQDRLLLARANNAMTESGYDAGDINSPLHRLLDLGVTYEFTEGGVEVIRFTYDRFLEYLLGRTLLEEGIAENLQPILQEAATFDSLRKGLESALLTFDRALDATGIQIVARLAENELDQWREFAAICFGKMSWYAEHSLKIVKRLSKDAGYWVRWAVGNSLREVLSVDPERCRDLEPLTADPEWERREVVTIALGGLTSLPERAISLLERLALDDHWRVRRVVAFSFGELIILLPNPAAQLSHWAHHQDWRVREALARSPRPLARVTPELATAVSELSTDAKPIVRRAVARSMRILAPSSPDLCVDTLMRMKTDQDEWVRKTVLRALSLPALATLIDQLKTLSEFASDRSPKIRWALARSLRRMSTSVVLLDTLNKLASDVDAFVVAAANFSLEKHKDERFMAAQQLENVTPSDVTRYGNEIVYELGQDTTRLRKSREDRTRHWVPDEYLGIQTAIDYLIGNEGSSNWPFLNKLAKDEDEGIRWGVTNCLSRTILRNREASLTLLGELAIDNHYWIRRAVVEVIGQMRPEDALATSHLLPILASDESDEVRLHVIPACRRVLSATVQNDHVFTAISSLVHVSGKSRAYQEALAILATDLRQTNRVQGESLLELIRRDGDPI